MPPKSLFVLLFVMLAGPLLAQTSKVGYVNFQQIQKQLPAYASAKGEIETFSKSTMAALNRQQKELEQKYRASALKGDSAVHFAMLRRESRVYYQQEALKQQEIFQKREQTLAAVDATIKKAVEEVARKEGYSGVIDIGSTIYYDQSHDITALVLIKLGVK